MSIRLLREFIRKTILSEGILDPGILKAVFMAGGPGSGKTHTAKLLFGGDPDMAVSVSTSSGLKLLNKDPAFEMFLKKAGVDIGKLGDLPKDEFDALSAGPGSPRGKAGRIRNVQQGLWTDVKLGLVLDGTGDDFAKIERKKNKLEELGYDTYMVFVNTSLEVAQERNQNRDRKLPRELVKEVWDDVQENMGSFQRLFGQSDFTIIDNTVYGPLPEEVQAAVDSFINRPIVNPAGRKWIESEIERKGPETIDRKAPGQRKKLLGDI
jgi:cytidylate kinase